jgi:hypothetical protein
MLSGSKQKNVTLILQTPMVVCNRHSSNSEGRGHKAELQTWAAACENSVSKRKNKTTKNVNLGAENHLAWVRSWERYLIWFPSSQIEYIQEDKKKKNYSKFHLSNTTTIHIWYAYSKQ